MDRRSHGASNGIVRRTTPCTPGVPTPGEAVGHADRKDAPRVSPLLGRRRVLRQCLFRTWRRAHPIALRAHASWLLVLGSRSGCGFEPAPASLLGCECPPATGLDDAGDLLEGLRHEHRAHLCITRLVPRDAGDCPELLEQAAVVGVDG